MLVSRFAFDPDKGIASVPNIETDSPECVARVKFLAAQTDSDYKFAVITSRTMNTDGNGNLAPGYTSTVQGVFLFTRRKTGVEVGVDAYSLSYDTPSSGESAGNEATIGSGADAALAELSAAFGIPVPPTRFRDTIDTSASPVGAKIEGYSNQYWGVSAAFTEAKYPLGTQIKFSTEDGRIATLRRSNIGGFGGSKLTPVWQRISADQEPL